MRQEVLSNYIINESANDGFMVIVIDNVLSKYI